VVPPHPHAPLRLSCPLLGCALLGVLAPCAHAMSVLGQELSAGGNLALTSDYIYRGVSESNDHAAVQADVHLAAGGTFGGLWASTRDRSVDPGGSYDFELYLGHRFDLSNAWNLTLSARTHDFAEGRLEPSADYQEVAGTLTYLDRWSLSLTVIPNAVRYWFYRRLTRAAAWDADTSGQWAIAGGLFATAGAGYYRSLGTGPGIARATGYAYGDLGLAYEWRRWRIDAGYFLVQNAAIRSSPYPVDNRHFAGTLSWRF
jgi:uncharacterized protein (TIGR02001 family)